MHIIALKGRVTGAQCAICPCLRSYMEKFLKITLQGILYKVIMIDAGIEKEIASRFLPLTIGHRVGT